MKDCFGFFLWETVDLPLEIYREDGTTGILQGLKNVIISFQQGKILIEKDKDSPDVSIDTEHDTINIHMSQEDTGAFREGEVDVQINLLYDSHERDTTCEAVITALRNLHKAVMD